MMYRELHLPATLTCIAHDGALFSPKRVAFEWVHSCVWTDCITLFEWVHSCVWTDCITLFEWVHSCVWTGCIMLFSLLLQKPFHNNYIFAQSIDCSGKTVQAAMGKNAMTVTMMMMMMSPWASTTNTLARQVVPAQRFMSSANGGYAITYRYIRRWLKCNCLQSDGHTGLRATKLILPCLRPADLPVSSHCLFPSQPYANWRPLQSAPPPPVSLCRTHHNAWKRRRDVLQLQHWHSVLPVTPGICVRRMTTCLTVVLSRDYPRRGVRSVAQELNFQTALNELQAPDVVTATNTPGS